MLLETVLKVKSALKRGCDKFVQGEKGEFGMSAIIGIAIGLIVAAFILIPGIRAFATGIITDMQTCWSNSISGQIFPR